MNDWKERAERLVICGGTYIGKWEVAYYGPPAKGRCEIIESDYPGHGKRVGVYETMEAAYRAAADHNEDVLHRMAHHAMTGE